jgi:ParB family chromosome partitioning protein
MEPITIHALFGKAILRDIEINKLHSGTYQPRDTFSEEAIASLSKTIAQLGVLEPLIVRASTKSHELFEIVAGERRFRAAKLAGLTVVPCLLSNYTNEQAAQIALIENTHREALNPIAEALAMKRLATEFRYTHDEIGLLLGISRSQVTNLLRLLSLDARIQHWMKQGHLSEGHGKLLAGLRLEKQYWYAYEAIKNHGQSVYWMMPLKHWIKKNRKQA